MARVEPSPSILYWHTLTPSKKTQFAVLSYFLLQSQKAIDISPCCGSWTWVWCHSKIQELPLLLSLLHSPRPCPLHVFTAKAGCCVKHGTECAVLLLPLGTSGISKEDPILGSVWDSVLCSSQPSALGCSSLCSWECGQYLLLGWTWLLGSADTNVDKGTYFVFQKKASRRL